MQELLDNNLKRCQMCSFSSPRLSFLDSAREGLHGSQFTVTVISPAIILPDLKLDNLPSSVVFLCSKHLHLFSAD